MTIYFIFGPPLLAREEGESIQEFFSNLFADQEKPDPCQANPSQVSFLNFEF
jgi:hypothetical protein